MKRVYARRPEERPWGTRGPYTSTLKLIAQANDILEEYPFALTLRQLFYQFVARGVLPNSVKSYDKVCDVMTKARYDGRLDWNKLIDRTRTVMDWTYRRDELDALNGAAADFMIDKWPNQPARIEVWLEKDAAIGTIEHVTDELRVPYGSTRGYHSTSGAYEGAKRILKYLGKQQGRGTSHR